MSDDNSKIINLIDEGLEKATKSTEEAKKYAKSINNFSNINDIAKKSTMNKVSHKRVPVDAKKLQNIIDSSVERSMNMRSSIVDKSLAIKTSADSKKAMKAISGAATIVGKGLSKLTDVTTQVIDNNFSKVGLSLNDVLSSMKESTKKAFYSINPLAGTINESAPVKQAKGAIKSTATFLLKKKDDAEIPRMSKGGVVGKKGLVELHPGEIVMPLSKAMKVMDSSMKENKKTSSALQKVLGLMPGSLKAYEADMNLKPTKSKTFVSGFIRSFVNINEQVQLPWQKRLIRTLTEMRTAMMGDSNRFKLAFERTLVEHPIFRGLYTFTSWLTKATKGIFGIFTTSGKSKYARDIPKSNNAMSRTADTLRVLYIGTMERLDKVINYQEQSHAYMSRQLTGEENNLKGSQNWSTKWEKFLHTMGADVKRKDPMLQRLMNPMAKYLGLDKQSLKKAGYNDIKDIFRPIKTYKLIKNSTDFKEAPLAEQLRRQPIPVEDKKTFSVMTTMLTLLDKIEQGVNKSIYDSLNDNINLITATGGDKLRIKKKQPGDNNIAFSPLKRPYLKDKKEDFSNRITPKSLRELRQFQQQKMFNKTLIEKVNKIAKFEERSYSQDKDQIVKKQGWFSKIKNWILWLIPLAVPFLKKVFKWSFSGARFVLKDILFPLISSIPGIGYFFKEAKALYNAKKVVSVGEKLANAKSAAKAAASAENFAKGTKAFKLNAEAAKLYTETLAQNSKTAKVIGAFTKNEKVLSMAGKFMKIAESPVGKMGGKVLGPLMFLMDFGLGFAKGSGGLKGRVATGLGGMLSSSSSSPTIRLLEGALKGGMVGALGGPPGVAIGAVIGGILGLAGAKNISGLMGVTMTGIGKVAKGLWWVIKVGLGGILGAVKTAIKISDFILNTIGAILTPWKSVPKAWKSASDYLVEAAYKLTGWMYELAEKFRHPILAYKEKQKKKEQEDVAKVYGKDSAMYKKLIAAQMTSGDYNDVYAWEAKKGAVKEERYLKSKTHGIINSIEDKFGDNTQKIKKEGKKAKKSFFNFSHDAAEETKQQSRIFADKLSSQEVKLRKKKNEKSFSKELNNTLLKVGENQKRKARTFFGLETNKDKLLNANDKFNPITGNKGVIHKLNNYLDRHDVDMDKKVKEVINYGGKVKITEITSRGLDNTRNAFNTDTLSKKKLMNKMDETNDASKKALKDATDMMTSVYNKSTKTIVTSINNSSNVVSNSDGGIKDKFSRMHDAIDKMINGVF